MPNQKTRQSRSRRQLNLHMSCEIHGVKHRIVPISSHDTVCTSTYLLVKGIGCMHLASWYTGIFCTCKTFHCASNSCNSPLYFTRIDETSAIMKFESYRHLSESMRELFGRRKQERCCWFASPTVQNEQIELQYYSIKEKCSDHFYGF